MTQVSKYLLQEDVKNRMFEVFWKTIADLKNSSDVELFFKELLTPTEQTMLAKRLAISILLTKKYSYEVIMDILKVSPATIGEISLWLKKEGKAFGKAVEKILTQEKQEEFWDNLEQYLTTLIPPSKGTDWKRVRSEQWHKLRQRRQKRTSL